MLYCSAKLWPSSNTQSQFRSLFFRHVLCKPATEDFIQEEHSETAEQYIQSKDKNNNKSAASALQRHCELASLNVTPTPSRIHLDTYITGTRWRLTHRAVEMRVELSVAPRQTDGQTDGQTDSLYREAMQWRFADRQRCANSSSNGGSLHRQHRSDYIHIYMSIEW